MRRAHLLIFTLVLAACVGCDHASKRVAESLLAGAPTLSFAWDAVRFELVSNPGAFLSLGAELPEALRMLILIGLVPVVLTLVCAYVLRDAPSSPLTIAALGLVAGGGLGNWIDRLLNAGAVTDFVSLGVGPLRTGIFNLADLAVVAGTILLLLSLRRAADEGDHEPEPTGRQRP